MAKKTCFSCRYNPRCIAFMATKKIDFDEKAKGYKTNYRKLYESIALICRAFRGVKK